MNELNRTPAAGWLRRLPRAVIAAFVCCFLAGYAAHLFAFTNIIPNSDGISRVSDPQQMTISGRWFLHYASMWNGFVQAPAVIGFFSVLFLSLASALTVSLLRVRSAAAGGLIGALMVVFPSVAYTFLYLFTASAYCFGILLAVLAVWLTDRYRLGFLPGVVLLALAVGTYQAYLAVAASLALLAVLRLALEGGHGAKELLPAALKQLCFLVLGLALYFLALRIFLKLKDLTLLNYKGIGSFGEDLTLKSAVAMVGSAYWEFLRYFFVPGSFSTYTTPVAAAGNAALALAGLWALVRVIRRNGLPRRPGAFALTLVFLALLPLAFNLTVLMGEAMPVMRYALVFAYVLALVLVDQATQSPPPEEAALPPAETEASASKGEPVSPAPAEAPAPRRLRVLRTGGLCAAVLLLIVSFNIDNLAYTVSAQAHRATESFATRLVERVESTPGYRDGMEVLIVGGFPRNVYYSEIEAFALVEDYSNLSSTVIPLNKHVYYYLNDWLNVPWPEPPESRLMTLAGSETFRSMPLYPADGSILIVRDYVIVKLAETYTPKKDYEIAYEQRR